MVLYIILELNQLILEMTYLCNLEINHARDNSYVQLKDNWPKR